MKKSLLISALAVTVLFSVVAFATADIAVYSGATPVTNAADPVEAKVTVNPKITLTVTTPDANQEVLFGAVDPGTASGPIPVGLSIDSNKAFQITSSEDLTNFSTIGLTRSLAAAQNGVKGQNQTFTDNYSINVPWTAEPGDYTAAVQYTVTQQ